MAELTQQKTSVLVELLTWSELLVYMQPQPTKRPIVADCSVLPEVLCFRVVSRLRDHLGAGLRSVRSSRGWAQPALRAAADKRRRAHGGAGALSAGTISDAENGKSNVQVGTLEELLEVMGVDAAAFLNAALQDAVAAASGTPLQPPKRVRTPRVPHPTTARTEGIQQPSGGSTPSVQRSVADQGLPQREFGDRSGTLPDPERAEAEMVDERDRIVGGFLRLMREGNADAIYYAKLALRERGWKIDDEPLSPTGNGHDSS